MFQNLTPESQEAYEKKKGMRNLKTTKSSGKTFIGIVYIVPTYHQTPTAQGTQGTHGNLGNKLRVFLG
jgi:hypothetical protein